MRNKEKEGRRWTDLEVERKRGKEKVEKIDIKERKQGKRERYIERD